MSTATLTASPPVQADPAPPAPSSRHRIRWVPALLLLAIAAFALIGPLVWRDPSNQELARFLEPPSWGEPLGRDHLGRSVAARLAHATRLSLGLGALCVAVAAITGSGLGLLAARLGGPVDAVLRSISEVMVALPAMLVVLLVAAFASGDLWTLYAGMALAQWIEYFRVVRARSGVLLAGPAVEAARLLQLGPLHVVRRHVWPELGGLLSTMATFGLVTSILTMSALSYVGVGVKPPRADLGLMLTESFPLYHEAPWLALGPVAVLALLTVSLLTLRRQEEDA